MFASGKHIWKDLSKRRPGPTTPMIEKYDKLLCLAYSLICLMVVSPIDLLGTFIILSKERSSLF